MPYIQCDLQVGLSDEKKKELVQRIIDVTHNSIGSAVAHINVVLREHPPVNLGEAGECGRQHNSSSDRPSKARAAAKVA